MIVGAPTMVRFRGVQFKNMGQMGQLARYPIHFHHCGDVSNKAYVYDCSIVDSNQRAVTIHDTHFLRVRRNVAFNIFGHAIFIEDGHEWGNVIEYNSVIFVRQDQSNRLPLPSDTQVSVVCVCFLCLFFIVCKPTAFWITHPNNFVNFNRASSVASHCFWIALPIHPIGGSRCILLLCFLFC